MSKKETFITALKANEGSIYKIAAVYTSTIEDRDDLVQEIIYQLWKSFETFNNRSSLNTWVYRVAMNVAIYHLKATKRKIPTVTINDQHINNYEAHNSSNEANWLLLKQSIDGLNLLDKGIVILYLEEKSYEEIAEIIGISVSNVGTKLSRIKEKIKKQILKNA